MFRLKQTYSIRFHFRQFLKYIETTSVETCCQRFSTAGKVYVMKWWKNYTHSYLRWITLLLFMTFVKNIIMCDVSWAVYHFLRHASTELGVTSLNFWPRRSALKEWHWDKFFTEYFDFPLSAWFFQCSIYRDNVPVGGRSSTISLPGESTCRSFDHQYDRLLKWNRIMLEWMTSSPVGLVHTIS